MKLIGTGRKGLCAYLRRPQAVLALLFALLSLLVYLFTLNNEAFYSKTIARVAFVSLSASSQVKEHWRRSEHTGHTVSLCFPAAARQSGKREYMSVQMGLLIVLFLLMAAVGGLRGVKSFFALYVNIVLFFIILLLIAAGLEPLFTTVVCGTVIAGVTLFVMNGVHKKLVSSLLSVLLTLLLTVLLTSSTAAALRIQGFGSEQYESIYLLSLYVHVNFQKIVLCGVMVALLGAVTDVSTTISSAMTELHLNNPAADKAMLFRSGIAGGKDILGTMTNTLLFAYIGGFMTLIVWFHQLNYSFADIVNNKLFCAETFQILCGGIGIVLVIPVTAFLASRLLVMPAHPEKQS